MNRTSLAMRAVVAFAVFAIENAASAQTIPGPARIYSSQPALQWTPTVGTPMFAPASPLRTYGQAGAPAFQLGTHGESGPGENRPSENRPEWLAAANQPGGVCRRRTAVRGLELQRSGL
jgi:hypothetical protein